MNERWDTPETTSSIRRVTKNGDDADGQDVVTGVEVAEDGMLRIDLRNLRPIRVLDRDNLVIEIYLADVMRAIAVGIEANYKS